MKSSCNRRLLSLLLALALVFGAWVPASAAGKAHLEVASQSVEDGGTVVVGDEIEITVGIKAVELATLTGGLHFDTDLFECVKVSFAGYSEGRPMIMSTKAEANSNGNVGFAYIGTDNIEYPAGSVFTATLKAIAKGEAEFFLYEDSSEYVESGAGANDYKSDKISSTVFSVTVGAGSPASEEPGSTEPVTPAPSEPETPTEPEAPSEPETPTESETPSGGSQPAEQAEPEELDRIDYSVFNNGLLTLSAGDISDKIKEVSDEKLDYITIKLPPDEAGELYYDFVSGSDNGGLVSRRDAIYRRGENRSLIGDVTYVPVIDYTGRFDLEYTAHGGDEGVFEGVIRVRVSEPESFTDTVDWNYNPAKWGAGRGIAQGYGGGLFGPNDNCTWGHILTFLWRAYGSPEPRNPVNFNDLQNWNAKAIQWAVENKIAEPEGAATFGTARECTRAQALQFIYKAAGSPSVSGLRNSFADVSDSADYMKAVLWGVDQGITNGTGKNSADMPLFSPDTVCTRGHIITFLYRAIERQGLVK